MDKAKIRKRAKGLYADVQAMQTDGEIPPNSSKEVFLLLFAKSLEGEAIQSVFD